jgi:hypothetical protein
MIESEFSACQAVRESKGLDNRSKRKCDIYPVDSVSSISRTLLIGECHNHRHCKQIHKR